MHNPSWQSVVISLEYAIQFEAVPNSKATLVFLVQFITAKRAYPFSIDETLSALRFVHLHPEYDLSRLLPQKHSDRVLRSTFNALSDILGTISTA